jgi:hypothetical protein
MRQGPHGALDRLQPADLPFRGARAVDPENAIDDPAVIVVRPSCARLFRGQKRIQLFYRASAYSPHTIPSICGASLNPLRLFISP